MICDGDGNIMDVNREAEAMFGISDKRIFAEKPYDFVPALQPDGSDSARVNVEHMKQTLREGHCRYEWLYQRRDGAPIPTEEIMSRMTLDGEDCVISFSRDLRGQYAATLYTPACSRWWNRTQSAISCPRSCSGGKSARRQISGICGAFCIKLALKIFETRKIARETQKLGFAGCRFRCGA